MELCFDPVVTELPTSANSNSESHHASNDIDYPELSALAAQLRIQPEINLNQNEETGEEEYSFMGPPPSYTKFAPPSFKDSQSNWKSLILFVSVRLGNDKINPFYIPCLKSLLQYKNCIGIIGGRPKHALYFIGYQGKIYFIIIFYIAN